MNNRTPTILKHPVHFIKRHYSAKVWATPDTGVRAQMQSVFTGSNFNQTTLLLGTISQRGDSNNNTRSFTPVLFIYCLFISFIQYMLRYRKDHLQVVNSTIAQSLSESNIHLANQVMTHLLRDQTFYRYFIRIHHWSLTGSWSKVHSEELHKLYPLPDIKIIKSWRMRWVWHVSHMWS
jgi:hypothetical protein